jgi:uncharacterized damage-inducible protein DinB
MAQNARRTQHPKEDTMRRIGLYFLILTALSLNFIPSSRAQGKPEDKVQVMGFGPDVPNAGLRAEFLEEVAYYEQRYTRLAEAMPAEKYGWRPGEGVRSVGEVFAHITIANYGIANALVAARTPGVTFSFDPKAIMALADDKPKLLQSLKESFAHFRKIVLMLDDADADKPQKMFNRQTTVRGSFIMITGHFGEHLGQSIAYARMNGIVPPWTEETQKQQQKPADKPKT